MKKYWVLFPVGLVSLFILLLYLQSRSTQNTSAAKPPAPVPAPAPAKVPRAGGEENLGHLKRLDACAQIEEALVKDGYDIQVLPMSDNDANIVIVGAPVNRLFVRQVVRSGIGRRLKERGIRKVTFMRDRYTWVGEWDVFYNKVEALD